MSLLRNIWLKLAYILRFPRGRVGLEKGEEAGRGDLEITCRKCVALAWVKSRGEERGEREGDRATGAERKWCGRLEMRDGRPGNERKGGQGKGGGGTR